MKSKTSVLLATLAIIPFTVGFAPPQEPGHHVSFSMGKGRYMSRPAGCAQPRLVDYQDRQLGYYYRWHSDGDKGAKVGAGFDINQLDRREMECTRTDCGPADSGWSDYPSLTMFSPLATLDWTWVGFSFGLHFASLSGLGAGIMERGFTPYIFSALGRGSLRLGRFDGFYGSFEFYDGRPANSGNGHHFGLGGRLLGFDLWAGLGGFYSDAGMSGVLARQVGPVRLRVAGNYTRNSIRFDKDDIEPSVAEDFVVRIPQTAISAGIDYRFPW